MTTSQTPDLVRRITDTSPEPLVGEIVGREDDERVLVAWGDSRHSDTAIETASVENQGDLTSWSHELQARSDYISGLRQLADILEQHPEVPLPSSGVDYMPLSITFWSGDAKQRLTNAMRAFPGPKAKDVRSGEYGDYFDIKTTLAGLHLKLTASRDQVCERVVTGTREVTKEIPDPEALAAVPTVTVTETVEDVQWVCAPLLADSAAAVTA